MDRHLYLEQRRDLNPRRGFQQEIHSRGVHEASSYPERAEIGSVATAFPSLYLI